MSAAPSSSTAKICFNPDCKESKFDRPRKGWKLKTGDFAQLCDRCGSAYEDGRFCELFHIKAAGWRGCESCRKPLHCGCIVSIRAFVLLDAGGVECVPCARKHLIMPSNLSMPPAHLSSSDRFKEANVKHLNHTMPVPNEISGLWWKPVNIATSQSELCPRMPCEVDRVNAMDKLISAERPSVSGAERVCEDPSERAVPSSFDLSVFDRISNKRSGAFRREEGAPDVVLHDSSDLPGENGSLDMRRGVIAEAGLNSNSNPWTNISLQSSPAKDPLLQPHSILVPFTPPNETNGSTSIAGTQSQRQTPPPPLSKQLHAVSQNGGDSSAETQMRNGKARGDMKARNQLLPRYWPKITDQELQQISGDSNVVITPLFEKILSASDAGRIGRLVLPKKCAEAYFPTISQPEGVPLSVQDAKGTEWVFQFRFWPNNNSRMYVLEGVTPCIQNMQLQAGDTITFSRKDPDGKLVMGFRKTSNTPQSSQDARKSKFGSGLTKHAEANLKEPSTWSEIDKSEYIAKDAVRAKSYPVPNKRKNTALGLKNKRLQIENEDLIELQITWEEAQGLLRPPPNHAPLVIDIDGNRFEEYEEAPRLGKPTIFTTDDSGENIQWAQCEECTKWRKLPVDVLLPSRWTCSDNSWDPKRSSCSSEQEITDAQIQDLLNPNNTASKKSKREVEESQGGLDTLANLAILGEVVEALPPSAQTTKHPRHRPGCTCIVCIQPPSGKGPKHSESCMCNVCLTVKRRFRTLMERRGKRGSENENNKKKKEKLEKAEKEKEKEIGEFKGGIDLNIQPEREDEVAEKVVVSGGGGGGDNVVENVENPEEDDEEHPVPLSVWAPSAGNKES